MYDLKLLYISAYILTKDPNKYCLKVTKSFECEKEENEKKNEIIINAIILWKKE